MTTPRRGTGCRLGLIGYASLLRDLQLQCLTAEAVAVNHSLNLNRARQVLRVLRTVRLARVAKWELREAPATGHRAVWGFGGTPDAPHPSKSFKRTCQPAKNLNATAIVLSHLLRALVRPICLGELAKVTGAERGEVGKFLAHCNAIGLCRVTAWKASGKGGQPLALWQLGDQPSAERPPLKSRSDINRESKQRRLARQQQLALQHAAFHAVAQRVAMPFGAMQ